MTGNIESIMSPKSIAVVGATNRLGSVGLVVFRNILGGGFQGVLYPVNPKAKSVQSVKAYPRLMDIADEVDLAVIIVPAEIVCSILEEAGQKQVKGAIIISAGFKEVGGHGVELENRVKEVAAKYGIRLVGPNCLGVINNDEKVRMNASFATKMPKAGNIAFISQSGALCTAVLDYAEGRNVGFSKFVSFGNKADVSEIDLLRYLKDDPDTGVILMYLEDISNGREFLCRYSAQPGNCHSIGRNETEVETRASTNRQYPESGGCDRRCHPRALRSCHSTHPHGQKRGWCHRNPQPSGDDRHSGNCRDCPTRGQGY